ncbi:MAG: hypothetical protein M3O46_04165 [Myxococcota bacterium]|nr:hypothetical protein [Myxococcota bacterium]
MTARGAALGLLIAAASGCRKPVPVTEPEPEASSASALSTPDVTPLPVDHLGPDELAEGTEQAFGVVLPRALAVKGSFAEVVYASAPASVHALTQYFRGRLQGGVLREGATAATFEHVKVRGKPGLELVVRIARAAGETSVEMRNATPPPAPDLPDEASRWKQVGLTPAGRLLDPSHLD